MWVEAVEFRTTGIAELREQIDGSTLQEVPDLLFRAIGVVVGLQDLMSDVPSLDHDWLGRMEPHLTDLAIKRC